MEADALSDAPSPISYLSALHSEHNLRSSSTGPSSPPPQIPNPAIPWISHLANIFNQPLELS